ncbi:hypothetical protein N7486_000590 [Penicillium sp. IBT 16267x]|nr:hypothetical protein N7486_000590 [Penicillium sp. IBT 16267x]
MAPSHLPLFGGYRAWNPSDWTSSDDRVRGGSSTSTLTCSPSSLTATFQGTLDIKTLGGAGFASQRTTGEHRTWDLSGYDGIELVLDERQTDGKCYTLTLKDEIPPKRPDGREQSTVSWEFDFRATRQKIFVRFEDFRATFRGRDRDDVGQLDLKNVKRFGIMMRSFFGDQEGPFKLGIVSISAVRNERHLVRPDEEDEGEVFDEKLVAWGRERRSGWFSWLSSCLGCRS